MNKILFAYLNNNSIRNKLDQLIDLIKGIIDVLMVSESKTDDSFPNSQFFLDEYSNPYRLDRIRNGEGIRLFVRNDTPSKTISIKLPTKNFLIELNLRKKRWLITILIMCGNIDSHLLIFVSKGLDIHLNRYENVILLGDFNASIRFFYEKFI